MKIEMEWLIFIGIFLLYINVMLTLRLIINKANKKTNIEKNESVIKEFIFQWIVSSSVSKNNKRRTRKKLMRKWGYRTGFRRKGRLLEAIKAVSQDVFFGKSMKNKFNQILKNDRYIDMHIRNLKSHFRLKRINAAVNLGSIGTEKARIALEAALLKEKYFPVRIYMANSLSVIGHETSIPILIESLMGGNRWYRKKINMLIVDFGEKLYSHLPMIIKRDELEIKELIIDFASIYLSDELKAYLFQTINELNHETKRLAYKAVEIASKIYYSDLDVEKYLKNQNIVIRNYAVKALANINSKDNLLRLIEYLKDEYVDQSALNSIVKMIHNNPLYVGILVNIFLKENNHIIKGKISQVLAGKLEYFIFKLSTMERPMAIEIIKEVLLLGKTSEIIGFMNKNKDLDLENELISIIKDAIKINKDIELEFCIYLKDKLIKKTGLIRCEKLLQENKQEKDKSLIKILYTMLVVMMVIFPIVYVIRYYDVILLKPIVQQIKTYIIDFNYLIVFYSVAVNLIYLFLVGLSFINVSKQIKLWNMKSTTMLFKKGMLPGVSIIAPAYNEEKTIIESANSLLNLKYPDYELIIVNDGSKDNTLQILIDYFDLKRVDYFFEYILRAQPVRGIYINPIHPKLIVIDKENGGKADSLNSGINISKKEYFCGIDADSLLEEDALLKLASQTLDEGCETPALGGNIIPVNGCKVDHGYITHLKIPGNNLARFQTVEYIRAFMAGRLGWAQINSLMIISGAFGLFRKKRIIETGGYLTSIEKYGKDTVGEDMELVVRISRRMRELGLKYKICYSFNANCWTEVPEDLGSLKRQRYRWHRGLTEILHFHKKVLFNPKYGRMGLVAMPYFFIFELMGPLIEAQGYLMVIAALLLGILNAEIALLLFISSIMLGILVSLSALIIAQKNNKHFNYGDILKLVIYSVIENFGIRQIFSLWRVTGYLRMFRKTQGWGNQERKGFKGKKIEIGG